MTAQISKNFGGINTVRDSSPLKTISSFQNGLKNEAYTERGMFRKPYRL